MKRREVKEKKRITLFLLNSLFVALASLPSLTFSLTQIYTIQAFDHSDGDL